MKTVSYSEFAELCRKIGPDALPALFDLFKRDTTEEFAWGELANAVRDIDPTATLSIARWSEAAQNSEDFCTNVLGRMLNDPRFGFDQEWVAKIRRHLRKDQNVKVRAFVTSLELCTSLRGGSGDEECWQALNQDFPNIPSSTRRMILNQLQWTPGALFHPRFLPIVIRGLVDSDKQVRMTAASISSKMLYSAELQQALEVCLKDSEHDVRVGAATAILNRRGTMNPTRLAALALLIDCLNNPKATDLHLEALRAIRKFPEQPGVQGILEKAFESPDPAMRLQAALGERPLGKNAKSMKIVVEHLKSAHKLDWELMGELTQSGPETVEVLPPLFSAVSRIADRDFLNRSDDINDFQLNQVILAVTRMDPQGKVAILKWTELATHRHPKIRLLSLNQLKAAGLAAKDAAPTIEKCLSAEDRETREAAARALAAVAPSDRSERLLKETTRSADAKK